MNDKNRKRKKDFQPESYQAYLAIWARICLRKVDHLRAKMDSVDLVQETLLQAHLRLQDFRGSSEGEFTAWLRQILQNKLWDFKKYYERDKRDVRKDDALCETLNQASIGFANRLDMLAAPLMTATQILARNERARHLAEALTNLPDSQRVAIELHWLGECSLDEAAGVMDRSPTSVAGLVRRGLQTLRTNAQK